MAEVKYSSMKEVNEEMQAKLDIWEYALGFTPMAVVKCAIELQIADVLESHGGAMINAALSAALGCSPSILHHIMRYLIHHGFFKALQTQQLEIGIGTGGQESSIITNYCYIQTALSRMLMRSGENSMAALVLLESSPVMLAPWHKLSSRALKTGGAHSAFGAAHGDDLWGYASENPVHSKLINDAMACHARIATSAIVDLYSEAFKGIGSLVDVGGGDGTALRTLVKACPWVRGINFDLPHVVSVAPRCDGIEHVDGDMFAMVPKADASFLMWVLHDWSDDECIQIFGKCREAIPEEMGKVIIAEAVIKKGEGEEEEEEEVYGCPFGIGHGDVGSHGERKREDYSRMGMCSESSWIH